MAVTQSAGEHKCPLQLTKVQDLWAILDKNRDLEYDQYKQGDRVTLLYFP